MRSLCTVFLFLLSASLWAQPASEDQLKAWIQDLGAEHYPVRQAAEEALRKQGGRVRPYLAPLTDSRDPEIRMRVKRLLQNLGPDLFSFLETKGTCKGEASEGSTRWPCILIVKAFDAESGDFTGTIEWTSLDALHEIKGTLTGETFTFRETGFIRKGNAIIGVEYTFALEDTKGSVLKGRWQSGTPRQGPVHLMLP